MPKNDSADSLIRPTFVMPIETRCLPCGKLLRVGDEYAGRRARCPACGNIYDVPVPGSAPEARAILANVSSSTVAAPAVTWYMRTPENVTYGPISRVQLDRWFHEGRISGECYLCEGEGGYWQPASAIFPIAPQNAFAHSGAPAASPYTPRGVAPSFAAPRHAAHLPHRGGVVLALAILGWLFCPVFSIFAWVLGSADLREMRAGRMDSSGYSLTQVGSILGMIQAIILLLGVGFFFMMLFIEAANGAG